MSIVLGIDEAGRGPVIGPLVICGVVCEETNLYKLKEIGVRDSKQLTKVQREALVPLIKNIIKDFSLIKIPPAILERENLNHIEIKASASLINKFMPHKRGATSRCDLKVFLDTPVQSKWSTTYCNKIKERCDLKRCDLKLLQNTEVEIIGEPHADANYPIVGAASILAKVARDKEIDDLHKKYVDFGSGYPADPKTAQFIKEWNKFPEIVRRKWDTCKEVLVTPGRIIVLGDIDTGKTEFCKWLVNSGLKNGYRVGVMDLDLGQSHIGPPGSLGFGIATKKIRDLSKIPATIIYPVGKLSPAGITELVIAGVKEILAKITSDIDLLIVDTSGYIYTEEAIRLKIQKIEVINPDRIVLLEYQTEEVQSQLEPLVSMLPSSKVWRFPVDLKARKKSPTEREKFREKRLRMSMRS